MTIYLRRFPRFFRPEPHASRHPSRHPSRWKAGALFGALAFVGTLAPADAGAIEIVPHEARYDLSLLELRSANKGSAGGVFLVRLARTCEGWALDTDLQVGIETEEGGETRLESRSRYDETLPGADGAARLEFRQAQTVNGNPISLVAGTARMGSGGGAVRFERPAGATHELAPDTKFPVAATRASMTRLFEGEKLVSQPLFDGGEDGPLLSVDLAAGDPEPPRRDVRGDTDLLQGRMLRTVTAFYLPDKPDSEPLTTYVSDIYDNGVTARLSIDVGLATVNAELTALRRLPPPEC